MAVALLISAVLSYLIGSCNSAIIVVKILKGKDVREYGSKNAGLTNTLRCFGKGPALLTLLCDLAKGVVAVLLSRLVFSLIGVGLGENLDTLFVGYVAGFFVIIGHILPVFYGFKGGKGILLAATVLLATDPITFAIVIPFFALILSITRYVSVSSILAAIAYPIITFFTQTYIRDIPADLVRLHTVLVAGTSVLLIFMHRTNIKRLKNGTENRFSFKSSGEAK